MKKFYYILSIYLLFSLIFAGCNFSFNKKKPNPYYYTETLIKKLASSSSYSCSIVDTNYYKEKEMSAEGKKILNNFIKTLNKNNYLVKVNLPSNNPQYKIIIKFEKEDYVINIYNENIISLFPWDGDFPMDYIDMSSIYPLYNLYKLCIFENTKEN